MNLVEYQHSDKAVELGISNEMPAVMVARAAKFLINAVQPLETLFHPHRVVMHSGYRSTKLNAAVKGKTFSQHLRANAIDFHVDGMTVEQAYRVILNSTMYFDQCILEGREGHQWIHLSYNTDLTYTQQRMEKLTLPDAP